MNDQQDLQQLTLWTKDELAALEVTPSLSDSASQSDTGSRGCHLARTLVVSADSALNIPRRSLFRLGILALLWVCFVVFCLGFDYYERPPLAIQDLANGNAPVPATLFSNRGTITDLTLSQPSWQADTVRYAMTFHATKHGVVSDCQGHITLRWYGFLSGWWNYEGETTCHPVSSP